MQRSSIIAITFTLLLYPLPTVAQDIPQACHDGIGLLGTDNYGAVSALNACIGDGNLTKEDLAIAYYNRSAANFFVWLDGGLNDDDRVDRAYEDVEVAIELNSEYGNAYCLRGKIDLEWSFDFMGYEDIDKGKALGGKPEICDL